MSVELSTKKGYYAPLLSSVRDVDGFCDRHQLSFDDGDFAGPLLHLMNCAAANFALSKSQKREWVLNIFSQAIPSVFTEEIHQIIALATAPSLIEELLRASRRSHPPFFSFLSVNREEVPMVEAESMDAVAGSILHRCGNELAKLDLSLCLHLCFAVTHWTTLRSEEQTPVQEALADLVFEKAFAEGGALHEMAKESPSLRKAFGTFAKSILSAFRRVENDYSIRLDRYPVAPSGGCDKCVIL